MKPLNEMSAQQKRLYDVMSDISEECYCAGWMAGNEYAIWDALGRNEPVRYGMGEIDKRKLTECASLSLATDSWIIWRDDQDGLDQHDSSEWGAYAISIDEWKKRVAERAVSPAESVPHHDMAAELKRRRASMYSSGIAGLSDIEFLERVEQALLVQPLQQFCGTHGTGECSCAKFHADPTNCGRRKEWMALQQEGGKDLISVLREYLLREMPSGTVINDPTWWAPRIARAIAVAAPQPSDNLQQVSTAEPDGRDVHRPLLIARIKRYRKEFGCTLKEAKEACEYGRDMNGDETAFLSSPTSAAQAEPAKEAESGIDPVAVVDGWERGGNGYFNTLGWLTSEQLPVGTKLYPAPIPTISADSIRQRFEDWARSYFGPELGWDGRRYAVDSINAAWCAVSALSGIKEAASATDEDAEDPKTSGNFPAVAERASIATTENSPATKTALPLTEATQATPLPTGAMQEMADAGLTIGYAGHPPVQPRQAVQATPECGQDERALFEAAACANGYGRNGLRRGVAGAYVEGPAQIGWMFWKARAALAQQKEKYGC